MGSNDRSTGVIVLGHGSARGRATEEGINEVVRRLGTRFDGRIPVRPAFFEFLHPTAEESIGTLANLGCETILVMPYFLFDGKEVKVEIPEMLAHLRAVFPGVRLAQLANLGADNRLIELLEQRVAEALSGLGQHLPVGGRLPCRGESGRLGVIVVNRGSLAHYDDGERLRVLCTTLAARLGAPVEPAQAENSDALTIENAADRLVGRGSERIVVAPHLHFPGKVLKVNVVPAVERAALSHPDRRFYLASTLCVNDRLVEICLDRVSAALVSSPVL